MVVYLLRVRFLVISHPDRIGHLAAEPDCYLKETLLGERPQVRVILLLNGANSANACLLDYWAGMIHVIQDRFLRILLTPLVWFPYLRVRVDQYLVAINDTATFPAIQARWGNRGPLLSLTKSDRRRGEKCLEDLGVPKEAWFVCVHSREGGFSPRDEHVHAFRNSEIDSYLLAMGAITGRGGWCIRMGDSSMKPLPQMPGVIDYAHSDLKSDWMDVFLCARCRFFLGNTSGLFLVSTVFGVRSVLVNLTPLSAAYPVGAADIGIPKLLQRNSGELVPFKEILDSPIANYRFANLYVESGLKVMDNSPEDIRDVVIEMLDQLEGNITYLPEDEMLQRRFRQLMRPGHYSFGSTSRIGRQFLRKHSHLLPATGMDMQKPV
jgi:putative glycosyltransferase (TIGR04372 family)